MSFDIILTFIYLFFVFCTIYPPIEFVSAGFTIDNAFPNLIGNDGEDFIMYHIKRTSLTLFLYSLLPIGYIYIISFFGEEDGLMLLFYSENILCSVFFSSAVGLVVLAVVQIYMYGFPSFENHPIVASLKQFTEENGDWRTVAARINLEFRSIDKICIQTNSITKLIVTENWVIKTMPLGISIVNQTDAEFVVEQSDTHPLSHLNTGEVQFITIEVKSARAGSFKIRLNAMDFRDVQDRIARVITVLPEVKFHKNIIDKFLDAFKEAISDNPKYKYNEELDSCIGCMQIQANVKIQRFCDPNESNPCEECRCKPMWCVDCMGRWFAHRQDPEKVDRWLSEKCTCPICRAKFCLLDISHVDTS